MSEFTRDEAAAFIEAMRRMIEGRAGFKWFAERLSGLEEYVDSLAAENERLNAYIDSIGARQGYEEQIRE